MRFLHIGSCFLLCSLGAGMEFPDTRLRDLKRDWTRFESAPNHESDSTMIHGKRLKTGESSWDGMHPSQNIHEPSGKGFHKDVEMEDVNEKPINREEEVNHKLDPCHEILQEFENWSNMLSKLSLTKDLQRRVEEEKDIFKKATKNLFESRNWLDLLGKDPERFSEHDGAFLKENIEQIIKRDKVKWLQSVFQIDQIDHLLPQQENELITRRIIIKRGYELMFWFMIEFKDMKLLSEEDLSSFLNKETDGKIIVAYANWSHFEPITGNPSWNFKIKESLQMTRSIYGLPEILNLLNQDTWTKIEVHYLWYQLLLLLRDQKQGRNYFYLVLNHFLQEANRNAMNVSMDQICVLLKQLSCCRQISAQANSDALLAQYMKAEGISTFFQTQTEFSRRKLIHNLIQIIEKPENSGLIVLLKCIQMKLLSQ